MAKSKPDKAAKSAERSKRVAARKEASAERIVKARAAAKKVPKPQFRNQARGFSEFLRKQGVIGLAVGLAIGSQAGATVKSIVEGFINPIVAFIVGSDKGLLDAKWNVIGKDTDTVNFLFQVGDRTLVFAWGSIFSSLITLTAVAAVVYYLVMGLKLDKLDKKKD